MGSLLPGSVPTCHTRAEGGRSCTDHDLAPFGETEAHLRQGCCKGQAASCCTQPPTTNRTLGKVNSEHRMGRAKVEQHGAGLGARSIASTLIKRG